MQAILIEVATMEISAIRLPDEEPLLFEAIKACIGCKVLALGAVFPNNDVLYVNQLGVMETERYFKHSLVRAPVADNAIVLGSVWHTGAPCTVRSTLAATRASVQFMDKWDTLEWAMATQAGSAGERAA